MANGNLPMRLEKKISATTVPDQRTAAGELIELSVVMPCLNEHETAGVCVRKAIAALRQAGISGEVILADNGSTDGSVEIAQAEGARVVHIAEKGIRQRSEGRNPGRVRPVRAHGRLRRQL